MKKWTPTVDSSALQSIAASIVIEAAAIEVTEPIALAARSEEQREKTDRAAKPDSPCRNPRGKNHGQSKL
jgi:hypothetical protein